MLKPRQYILLYWHASLDTEFQYKVYVVEKRGLSNTPFYRGGDKPSGGIPQLAMSPNPELVPSTLSKNPIVKSSHRIFGLPSCRLLTDSHTTIPYEFLRNYI